MLFGGGASKCQCCWSKSTQEDEQHDQLYDRNTPVKIADIWTGRNYLCWSNRLIFGPDWAGLLFSNLLIIIPSGLFCGFVAVDWFRYIGVIPSIFMMIGAVILLFLSLYFLMKTGTTDPGYVWKNIDTVKHLFKPDETDTMIANQVPPPYKETTINNVIVRLKWCRSCKVYRPPRASHCKRCNSCIERFDHHCPWTGTCIGRRNHRYFFGFVTSTTILCAYAALCSIVQIAVFVWRATLPEKDIRSYKYHDMDVGQGFVQSLMSSPVSYLIIFYGFIMGLSVGGLMLFHLYLLSRNVTTYENINNAFEDTPNPFSNGIRSNLYEMLCRPLPPPSVKFNETVIMEEEVVGEYDTDSDDLNSERSFHEDV